MFFYKCLDKGGEYQFVVVVGLVAGFDDRERKEYWLLYPSNILHKEEVNTSLIAGSSSLSLPHLSLRPFCSETAVTIVFETDGHAKRP